MIIFTPCRAAIAPDACSLVKSIGMNKTLKAVAEFHQTFGAPVLESPAIPPQDRVKLRLSLILEELHELAQEAGQEALFIDMLQKKVADFKGTSTEADLTGVMDALCDLQVVLNGSILEFGLQPTFDAAFDEVHRSNMSKACTNEADAQASVKKYAAQGVAAHYQLLHGKYVIYRSADNKILKGVDFSEPALEPYSK